MLTIISAPCQDRSVCRPVQSDQPMHCTQWTAKLLYVLWRLKTLIKLCRCKGWSEVSLATHDFVRIVVSVLNLF